MRVLELDGMEKKGDDTMLDLKVLADRGHYCLSHRGVAGEVAAITGLSRAVAKTPENPTNASVAKPVVSIVDEECVRYIARRIEGVAVGESPQWLRERLAAIGQKSINSIVDATNYVMFDIGQPLHAFDADKVVGGITVRTAKAGEKITTLDGKEVALNSSVLLIADEAGPLAIAGIKGGTRAQVEEHTKNIILESANFHAGATRSASMALGIRTDASKRFENGITPEYALVAMEEVTALILAHSPSAQVGPMTDVYPSPMPQTAFSVNLSDINKRLGIAVPRDEAIAILKRLGIGVVEEEDALMLTIPHERLDLAIPEDIVEEIGRLYGYEKIPDMLPPRGVSSAIDKGNYYREKIRDILAECGFSEVYLYSLAERGDYEIELPPAEDKKFLRTSLVPGLSRALSLNAHNAPLLGLSQIKLFEFGSVFPKDGERVILGLGVENASGHTGTKPDEELKQAVERLREELGLPSSALGLEDVERRVAEWPLDALLAQLPDPPQEPAHYAINRSVRFKKFSPYPFIARDIALWVAERTSVTEVESLLRREAGELLARLTLFDEYQKNGRTSYAFRLVFQSMDRTLTGDEVNIIMERVAMTLQHRGWEVR